MSQTTLPPAPDLSRVAVILVEPQTPGNIGMVCRAMANFGASDLRLVNPCQHLHAEARKFAVFAHELLGQARIYPDLPAALADLHIAVATTRRGGKLRGEPLDIRETPPLLHNLPQGQRMGLVFGREDAGLTTGEIAQCSHTAAITTDPQRGSLNLAQAALLFLHELGRPAGPPAPPPAQDAPPLEEMEQLFAQMESVLHRIAFLNPSRPEQVMIPLRRMFHRAVQSRQELGLMRGIWSQLAWSIRDWQGRKRGD